MWSVATGCSGTRTAELLTRTSETTPWTRAKWAPATAFTALYELKLRDDADGALATVMLRYEDPDTGEVSELSREFQRSELAAGFEEASPRFQMAAVVAEYAELLRGSYWAQDGSLSAVVPGGPCAFETCSRRDISVAEFADLSARTEKVWATMNQ